MESGPQDGTQEPYDVDVEAAATLLGVGKTRLSQLTSRGVFSFLRRKVGTRNRLFYRKSELLAYLDRHYPAPAPRAASLATPLAEAAPAIPLEEPAARLPPRLAPRSPVRSGATKPKATELRRLKNDEALQNEMRALLQSLTASLGSITNRISSVERQLRSLEKAVSAQKRQQPLRVPPVREAPAPAERKAPRKKTTLLPEGPRKSPLWLAQNHPLSRKEHRQPTSTLPTGPRRSRKRKESS